MNNFNVTDYINIKPISRLKEDDIEKSINREIDLKSNKLFKEDIQIFNMLNKECNCYSENCHQMSKNELEISSCNNYLSKIVSKNKYQEVPQLFQQIFDSESKKGIL